MMDGKVNNGDNMLRLVKNKMKERKKGAISIITVLLSLGAVIILIGIITTYEHQMIIRNFEAVSDLAAVESLRKYMDENALRNEKLVVKEENLTKIRDDFLKRIRSNTPSKTYSILRIEIPTIDSDGNVVFSDSQIKEMDFPNSKTTSFYGPTTVVNNNIDVAQTSYFIGGTTTDKCAFEISKISGNLAASGKKKKDAYILTSKVTIFFDTNSFINNLSFSLLNYVNILSGNERSVITKQIDKNTIAVTIQTIGEVVLR